MEAVPMIAACPWPQYDDAAQDVREDAGRPIQRLGQEPGFIVALHTVPPPAQRLAETLAATAPETLIHGDAPFQGIMIVTGIMTAGTRIGPFGPCHAGDIYGTDTTDKGRDPAAAVISTIERKRLLVGPEAPVAGSGSGGVTFSAAWSQIAGLHALSSGAPVSISIPSQDLREIEDPIIARTGRVARLAPVNSAPPEDTSSNIRRSFDGKPFPAGFTIREQGCQPSGIGHHGNFMLSAPAFHS
jgi:hypothetical protein